VSSPHDGPHSATLHQKCGRTPFRISKAAVRSLASAPRAAARWARRSVPACAFLCLSRLPSLAPCHVLRRPLCGAEVRADCWLDSREGRGWQCTRDANHYRATIRVLFADPSLYSQEGALRVAVPSSSEYNGRQRLRSFADTSSCIKQADSRKERRAPSTGVSGALLCCVGDGRTRPRCSVVATGRRVR